MEVWARRSLLNTPPPVFNMSQKHPSPALQLDAKVENEFRILTDLANKGVENIVRPHALATNVEVGGKRFPCFMMEFAQELELNKYLQRNGPVDPKDVEDYLLKISKTMSEVHKAGYIHRDMKPENLFVKDVGGANLFTIIDWGIAAVKDDQNTFALTQTKAWTPFWCPLNKNRGLLVSEMIFFHWAQ